MARTGGPQSEDLLRVSKSGLHCAAGAFWIDPIRPVPLAVITHGHADHARPGSERYVCTAESAPILRRRLGEDIALDTVSSSEPLSLGSTTVSFHPAGHVLGSAQIRVDDGDRCTVVTGDFKRDPDPTCAPFEVVTCDTLITEATFALPVYHWRPTEQIAEEALQFHRQNQAEDRTTVLLCYALGKAQRLLAELGRAGLDETVWLHGALVPIVEIYREAGIEMPPTKPVTEAEKGHDFGSELVLAPPSVRGQPWLRRFKRPRTGFASGWMQIRGSRRRRSVDRGFVLSDHADWPALIRTAEESRARRVLTTHGYADVLARYLREHRDIEAEVLGAGEFTRSEADG